MSAPSLPWAKSLARWRAPFGAPALRGMSIRWRLTLSYTAVLAVTLAVFSLIIYWFANITMIQEVDRASVERADRVSDILQRNFRAGEVLTSRDQYILRQERILDSSLDPFNDPGVGVRVRAYLADGVLPFASPVLTDTNRIPVDWQFIRSAEHGRVTRAVQPTAEGPFYVYTRPVYNLPRPELRAVVQLYTSLTPHYKRLELLGRLLVIGTILGTLLALVVGAAIAQVALAPIAAITRTASQINWTQDLGRRIPDTGKRDELGRLATTFNEMLDRIQAMFDRQRQLVADVSHELRTPLTTIRGELDLMARANRLDPEGLEAMRQESARMTRMVNDLLLLAQADSGLAIERYPVALDALVHTVARQARTLAGDPEQVRVAEAAPVTVLGDADRLRQLLLNLVDNALKHNPPGTTVRLALRQEGEEALLTVTDDGRGIPEADLDGIFDRFYRVDKARSRAAGGSGLGLSIVKWIAGSHGGSVSVTSAPEVGTTFLVRLPMMDGDLLD